VRRPGDAGNDHRGLLQHPLRGRVPIARRPRTVLVTGAGGQVGRALRDVLPYADFRARSNLDVTDEVGVRRALEGKSLVIHTAAMTNVDACEADPESAAAINDRGTRNVVAAARSDGAKVVYLSTDYVFAGDAPPYDEDDVPGPINVYGRTKLAGEEHLDLDRDLVVRTSWVFGGRLNFVRVILGAAARGSPTVVDDQVGRPTAAAALARALAHVARDPALVGRLHVSGDGPPCSRADLADAALEAAGLAARATRVDSASYAAASPVPVAPRPANTTLRLTRARRAGVPLEDWRTSLDEYVKGIG
jgi:dTDP-4-dehydrorhamnose reductase